MRRLNPAYQERLERKVNGCPYFGLISMALRFSGQGQCRIEAEVQRKHLQPFGMVHGGVYASLLDAASFWAVYSLIDEGLGLTTVELKTNYLAPAAEGYLIARGKDIKVGRTLCLGEASVESESGRLLAHGTATMMILEDLEIQDQDELPPKFLP